MNKRKRDTNAIEDEMAKLLAEGSCLATTR